MTLAIGVLRRHRFDLAILFQNAFEAALISFPGWHSATIRLRDGRSLLSIRSRCRLAALTTSGQYYWDLTQTARWAGRPTARSRAPQRAWKETALIAGRLA